MTAITLVACSGGSSTSETSLTSTAVPSTVSVSSTTRPQVATTLPGPSAEELDQRKSFVADNESLIDFLQTGRAALVSATTVDGLYEACTNLTQFTGSVRDGPPPLDARWAGDYPQRLASAADLCVANLSGGFTANPHQRNAVVTIIDEVFDTLAEWQDQHPAVLSGTNLRAMHDTYRQAGDAAFDRWKTGDRVERADVAGYCYDKYVGEDAFVEQLIDAAWTAELQAKIDELINALEARKSTFQDCGQHYHDDTDATEKQSIVDAILAATDARDAILSSLEDPGVELPSPDPEHLCDFAEVPSSVWAESSCVEPDETSGGQDSVPANPPSSGSSTTVPHSTSTIPGSRPADCTTYIEAVAFPIRVCAKGAAVKQLQLELRLRGYDIEADGFFGLSTYNAVRGVQATFRRIVNGEVDEQLWAKLFPDEEPPFPS